MQELDGRISKHYLSALGTAVEAHLGTIWAILVGVCAAGLANAASGQPRAGPGMIRRNG